MSISRAPIPWFSAARWKRRAKIWAACWPASAPPMPISWSPFPIPWFSAARWKRRAKIFARRFHRAAENHGIGNGDHEIGIGGALAGQQAAQIFARRFHRAAENHGIGAREIDMFKDALGTRLLRGVALAGQAFGADDHHLAGVDIVQIDRADQVEGAGFGGEDVALAAT